MLLPKLMMADGASVDIEWITPPVVVGAFSRVNTGDGHCPAGLLTDRPVLSFQRIRPCRCPSTRTHAADGGVDGGAPGSRCGVCRLCRLRRSSRGRGCLPDCRLQRLYPGHQVAQGVFILAQGHLTGRRRPGQFCYLRLQGVCSLIHFLLQARVGA